MHVLARVLERIAQHALDVGIAQAVGRLYRDRSFDAAGALFRRNRKQAVGVDLERDADARRAGDHRRNALELEAGERAAVGHQLALALHHVDAHAGLAILEGGELLRKSTRLNSSHSQTSYA